MSGLTLDTFILIFNQIEREPELYRFTSAFEAYDTNTIQYVLNLLYNRSDDVLEISMLDKAVKYNCPELVQYIVNPLVSNYLKNANPYYYLRSDPSPYIIDNAVLTGNLDMIRWLWENNVKNHTSQVLPNAILSHDLSILAYLYGIVDYKDVRLLIDMAAEEGQLDMIIWIHQNESQIPCLKSAMESAIRHGHLNIVEWFYKHRMPNCEYKWINIAAKHGHLDILMVLNEKAYFNDADAHAMNDAAGLGYLDVVIFLSEYRTEGCTTYAMDSASSHGQLEVVKYLNDYRDEGCTRRAMDSAANNGHFDVVVYLHTHRREGCSENALIGAIGNDHINIVEYLSAAYPDILEHVLSTKFDKLEVLSPAMFEFLSSRSTAISSIPLIYNYMEDAIHMNNKEMFYYLSQNFSDYSSELIFFALGLADPEIFYFILDNVGQDASVIVSKFISNIKLPENEIIQRLDAAYKKINVHISSTFVEYVIYNEYKLLFRLIVEQGADMNDDIIDMAITTFPDMALINWLQAETDFTLEGRPSHIISNLLINVSKKGFINTLKWLNDEYGLFSKSTIVYAALNGHKDVVEWAYHMGGIVSFNMVRIIGETSVATIDYMEIVEWLFERSNFDVLRASIGDTIVYGKLYMLKWIYRKMPIFYMDNTLDTWLMRVIATHHHLDIARWYYDNIFIQEKKRSDGQYIGQRIDVFFKELWKNYTCLESQMVEERLDCPEITLFMINTVSHMFKTWYLQTTHKDLRDVVLKCIAHSTAHSLGKYLANVSNIPLPYEGFFYDTPVSSPLRDCQIAWYITNQTEIDEMYKIREICDATI